MLELECAVGELTVKVFQERDLTNLLLEAGPDIQFVTASKPAI
jgi:hypothetical protein